jgi:inosose dehydratase
MSSRRDFLRQLGVGAAAGALIPNRSLHARMLRSAPSGIQFGYAAITWGGNDDQAIEDISALGFPGIQLRANVLAKYAEQPSALRDLLAQHHLTFVALSSGNVSVDPSVEIRMLDEHLAHAKFLRDAGGLYLQLIDERPKGWPVDATNIKRLGRLLTEIGKRTADVGIPVAYHPHMGSIGERPNDAERVLEESDPKYVRLLLDVAHYQVGGGDPATAIRKYKDRLLLLHIKDARRPIRETGPSYEFVELGKGSVDLPGVFAALRDVKFHGWAIVELDSVPDNTRTPKESAAISKRYLQDVIGARV